MRQWKWKTQTKQRQWSENGLALVGTSRANLSEEAKNESYKSRAGGIHQNTLAVYRPFSP